MLDIEEESVITEFKTTRGPWGLTVTQVLHTKTWHVFKEMLYVDGATSCTSREDIDKLQC